MNLDDLFGHGVLIADEFLVKAQLRVRVKEHRLPAAQDLIRRLEEAYDERMALLTAELTSIVKHADARKSLGLFVVDDALTDDDLVKTVILGDLLKAGVTGPGTPVKQPTLNVTGKPRAAPGTATGPSERKEMDASRAGSKGGKWYMTESGKIRYGTKPVEAHREATPEEVAEHTQQYRPLPFMGTEMNDEPLVRYLLENHEKLGFSPQHAQFLAFWYADDSDGESGLDRFIDTFFARPKSKKDNKIIHRENVKRDILTGDLSQLRLTNGAVGVKDVSFQEAVLAFFRIQEGWNPDGDESEEAALDYADEFVVPVLQDMFEHYESLKSDPTIQEHMAVIAQKIEEETYAFFTDAHKMDQVTTDWAANLGGADEHKYVTNGIINLSAMRMLFIPGKGETNKAAHVKGAVAPNVKLFDPKSNGYLLNFKDRLGEMNIGQLMSIYSGCHLYDAFDDTTRRYDDKGAIMGVQGSPLADHVLDLINQKSKLDATGAALLKQRLDALAQTTAARLTQANIGKDPLTKKLAGAGEHGHNPAYLEKLQIHIQELMERSANALAAQKNDDFTLPKSMADGMLGAVHHGDSPLDQHHILDENGEKKLDEDGKPKTYGLFKHQRQAINWMLSAMRGLLSLDAGMGKTPTVITFCEHLREIGHLKEGEAVQLYLPPSLLNQWPSEIEKYAPGIKKDEVLSLSGMTLAQRKAALKSPAAKKAKYILISTGTLTNAKAGGDEHDEEGGGVDDELKGLLKGIPGPVFIDEVHSGGFKDEQTERHQVAKAIMADRDYAFGMTATPMPNGPMDLYHLTNLFAPDVTGDKAEWEGATHNVEFDDETSKWTVSNPVALMEMRERVRPFVMTREITDPEVVADIGDQLGERYEDPDLQPIDIPDGHEMYEHHKPGGKIDILTVALYQRLVKKHTVAMQAAEAKGDMEGVAEAENRLAKLEENKKYIMGGMRDGLRRQAEISPELYDKTYKGGSPKIDRMVSDIVKHFKGGGGTVDSPIVMFSSMPGKAFGIIKRELVKAGIDPSLIGEIHGGKNARERAFEQDMTNAGKRKILLVGTKSGGAGLNLQKAASRVMFLDQPTDPAAKRQAIGRVWRPGQKKPVMESNYRMRSKYGETWDEKTTHNLAGKQSMVTAMTTDMDLSTADFTEKSEDAIKKLGTKIDGGKGFQQGKLIVTPEVEWLASQVDLDELSGDPESASSPSKPMEEHFDPVANAALAKEAPHLARKIDIKEEKRLWDRKFDIEGAPSKWNLQNILMTAATNDADRQSAMTSIRNLAKQCAGWRNALHAEAKAHLDAGNKPLHDHLAKLSDRLTSLMPDAFKKLPFDEALTAIAKDPGALMPAGSGGEGGASTPAEPKAGKAPKAAAAPKAGKAAEPKAAAAPKVTPAAKAPKAAEPKAPPAAKEAKEPKAKEPKAKEPKAKEPAGATFAVHPKNSLGKKDAAHPFYEKLLAGKPKTMAQATKLLMEQLAEDNIYKKKDHPEVAKQLLAYFKANKLLVM